jgi:hypothetical protein
MTRIHFHTAILCCGFFLILPGLSGAKPRATVKQQTLRLENTRKDARESLVLPYAFTSDSMGTVVGAGGGVKGYYQEQLLLGGTLFGATDEETYGAILGAWDYRPPWTERLFFTAVGSYGHYPRQRAYAKLAYEPGEIRPGSNGSDKDNYVETGGENNWLDFKLEYVFPIGAGRDGGMATYHLRAGMLESGSTGGDSWNPMEGGVTTLVLRQYNQTESFEFEFGALERSVHPIEVGIGYNNTDYPTNPSTGSNQYLSVKHDFGWDDATTDWTFIEFETSKYFSFGESETAKQRVAAFNFWTGDAPEWGEEANSEGLIELEGNPPQYDGATLGGFYRMRGYPSRRFHDRSVVYATGEYRYTPKWNPIGEISWLGWLKMDWWQFVGFVEGGRVAPEYSASELFSDWKVDAGVGIRAMMAGAVVRLDIAASEEGAATWVMFGHPF